MSLLPLILNVDDALHDIFSYGLYPGLEQPRGLQRRWSADSRNDSNINTLYVGKDGFEVSIDVQHFRPNEVIVKIVHNTVVVEGKHEEKEDEQSNIYQHFVRRFELPSEIDVNCVVSTLSSDGLLTIKAPKKIAIDSNERIIEIQQIGPTNLSIHTNDGN